MDAENKVEGEDGQQGPPEGEAPQAPAAEAAPSAPPEGPAGGGESGTPGEPGAEARAEESPAPLSPEQAEALVAGEVRRLNHMTVTHVPLEQLDEDATYRLRPEGDVSALATDVARLGQLFPVDVRPVGENHFQVISGFRRVAALRFLKRDRALVRIHARMSDEDALLLSLAVAIHAAPVDHEQLAAKKEQLEAEGRLSAAVRDMLEKALATEDELDADELAGDVTQRLGDINQDLALLADVFGSLDDARKAELLNQLRYSAELVAYLEGL
jgi:ParB-like chromosome segregation protein Spo0J